VAGDRVFFVAGDATHGFELWRSDGTESGTELVKDIVPGVGSLSTLGNFAVLGDSLFFDANDGISGASLWTSDGTAAGTSLVATIGTSVLASPAGVTAAGGAIFFVADNRATGRGLWGARPPTCPPPPPAHRPAARTPTPPPQ